MRPGTLFDDLHLYDLLESLIPDFVLAFAFFTSIDNLFDFIPHNGSFRDVVITTIRQEPFQIFPAGLEIS